MEKKNQHKFKRSLSAAAITAGVLVVVLLLNIGFTLLSNRFLLKIDMTKEKFNEICDASIKMLDTLDPEENDISIYFLADPDELQSAAIGYSEAYYSLMGYEAPTGDLWGMKYIYDLAYEFADRYDFITVETLNLRRDAGKLEQFRSTLGTELTSDDVIIDNYTAEKDADGNAVKDENGEVVMHHNFRIISRDNFFAYNSENQLVYAFKGDEQFTSTILSLSGANPTVYFVSGHGEKVGDYTVGDNTSDADYGEAQALRDLFFDAGFATRKIDLDEEYERLFADETARILVLYGPQTDYSGDEGYTSGSVSEIDILRRFLVNPDHHMMVFMDETEDKLVNLEEYLYDFWGVRFGEGILKDNGSNSLSDDGLSFIAEYETNKYSVGINLVNQLNQLDSQPIIGFANARPIELDVRFSQSSGYYENAATAYAGGVFYAPSSATVQTGDDVAKSAEPDTETDTDTETEVSASSGEMLAALTYEKMLDSNNDEQNTYVFSCGTTAFASEKLLGDATYGNRDVLYYAMRLMGKEVVLFDIDFKVIESEGLEGITESNATAWTIVLSSALPLAALITGTVVFIKRRHS